MPRHLMVRYPHAQPGPEEGQSRSPLKVPCKKLEPLKNAARIRLRSQVSLNDTDAARLVAGRGDARFVLAVCAR